MCLNYKEYLKRLKEGKEQRDKSVGELTTSINNIMVDIQTLDPLSPNGYHIDQ